MKRLVRENSRSKADPMDSHHVILKMHHVIKNQPLSQLTSAPLVAYASEDFKHGPSCVKRDERCVSVPYMRAARSLCKIYTGSSHRRGNS